MPLGGYLLVGTLGLLLALLAVRNYAKRQSIIQLGLQLTCIVAYFAAVIHFLGLPPIFGVLPKVVAKGPEEDQRFWVAVVLVYLFVVFGMIGEAFYSWLDKPRADRQQGHDWGGMIKPLFVSPLILIPTVAAFQNANINLTTLGFPWLMILLTAFEKGFLWRHYLAKRGAELDTSGAQAPGGEKK